MPRKKQADAGESPAGTATEHPPPEHPPDPLPTTSPGDAPRDTNGTAAVSTATGDKRKPNQTFKIHSDRTTVLEVAIWENEVRYDDKVSVQHSIQLSRSYKNGDGKWVSNTAYRTHDLPLVRFLMDKAHSWCTDRRTQDSSCPF